MIRRICKAIRVCHCRVSLATIDHVLNNAAWLPDGREQELRRERVKLQWALQNT